MFITVSAYDIHAKICCPVCGGSEIEYVANDNEITIRCCKPTCKFTIKASDMYIERGELWDAWAYLCEKHEAIELEGELDELRYEKAQRSEC